VHLARLEQFHDGGIGPDRSAANQRDCNTMPNRCDSQLVPANPIAPFCSHDFHCLTNHFLAVWQYRHVIHKKLCSRDNHLVAFFETGGNGVRVADSFSQSHGSLARREVAVRLRLR
jgi:hypothetical protein